MRVGNVTGITPQILIEECGRHGVSKERLLNGARISPEAIHDATGQVPLGTMRAVWKSAIRLTDDAVFTRPSGRPVLDFRVTWRNACIHAGFPNLLFHDLRRTAARNLRRIGVGENVIMTIEGWKTRSAFHLYDIVDNRDIADAMQELERTEKAQQRKNS